MMAARFGVLGPLEASAGGRRVDLGPPRQRALLALMLLEANAVVTASRLIDQLWPEQPPATAANIVQGYVSQLRKALCKESIETRGAAYGVRVADGELDLHRFQQLTAAATYALSQDRAGDASESLRSALALWRGRALADLRDEPALHQAAVRLDELRILATERKLEADLALGLHAEAISDAAALVSANPLRERPRELLMLALYRSGRQAEALAEYRTARRALVDELGIEPGPGLQALEQAILRHDPALALPTARPVAPAVEPAPRLRSILAAALDLAALPALVALAEPLARSPARELVLVSTTTAREELAALSVSVQAQRSRLAADGLHARAAVFTSIAPGVDFSRLVTEQETDLLLVDAPESLLEDGRLLTLLQQAPCDVGVVVGGRPDDAGRRALPVLVAFTGAEHDWTAVELGAWLARNRGVALQLAGAATGPDGRDASRLLASASLAVQRSLGVPAEPLLVDPDPAALVDAATGASIVVVGLTERWRSEGLGRARTALATQAAAPAILVRRGVRPGGLAPRASDTQYTWTLGPAA